MSMSGDASDPAGGRRSPRPALACTRMPWPIRWAEGPGDSSWGILDDVAPGHIAGRSEPAMHDDADALDAILSAPASSPAEAVAKAERLRARDRRIEEYLGL